MSRYNNSNFDLLDQTFHTANDDIENTFSNEELNNKEFMDNCYISFVQNIKTSDGRKFFNSLMAGDYATSTKLAVSFTSSSNGDQSEEAKIKQGSNKSYSATLSMDKEFSSFNPTMKICPIHKENNCVYVDAERVNKLALGINLLENARDIKRWMYQIESVLNMKCMENILYESVKILTDRRKRYVPKFCELNDPFIVNVINRFVSKPVKEYIRNRVQETENNDCIHMMSFVLEYFDIQCDDREFHNYTLQFEDISDMNVIIKIAKTLKNSVNLLSKVKYDEEVACIELFTNNNIPFSIERSWEESDHSLNSLISNLEIYTKTGRGKRKQALNNKINNIKLNNNKDDITKDDNKENGNEIPPSNDNIKSSKIKNKKTKCYKCQKFGHEAKNCYKTEDVSESDNDSEEKSHNSELNQNDFVKPKRNSKNKHAQINALFSGVHNISYPKLSNDQIKLIDNIGKGITPKDIQKYKLDRRIGFDTGAEVSCFSNKNLFDTLHVYENLNLTAANGTTIVVRGIGTFRCKINNKIYDFKALYTPSLKLNFLSLKSIFDHNLFICSNQKKNLIISDKMHSNEGIEFEFIKTMEFSKYIVDKDICIPQNSINASNRK